MSHSCDDIRPLLPLVAEGLIDAESDPHVFHHLHGCDSCQRELAGEDLITLALAGAADVPAGKRQAEVVHYRLPWPASLAAGLLLALGLFAVWQWQQADIGPGPEPLEPGADMMLGGTIEGRDIGTNGEVRIRVRYGNGELRFLSPKDIDGGADEIQSSSDGHLVSQGPEQR